MESDNRSLREFATQSLEFATESLLSKNGHHQSRRDLPELRRLLNLKEVATILNVSPHTVRSWIRKGRLRPLRLCRRLLFCPDEVARLVAEAK